MLQKWKKHRPGWFEQKCRGKFGTYPDKISEFDQFRRPEEREFTSLPTNFDRDRLDEIAVFKDFELQKFGTNAEDVKENPIRNWGGPIDQIRNVCSNHPSARASFNTNFQNEEQHQVHGPPNLLAHSILNGIFLCSMRL